MYSERVEETALDKKRLVLEYNAMMERWSQLNPKLCRDSSCKKLWWELNVHAEEGNQLPIKIKYPPNYPASPPEIVISKSMPSGTPHTLSRNRMCWFYPDESKRNKNIWCPSKDTAAMCVGVAQRWFYAFLVWLSIKKWPVPDAID